MVRRCFVMFLMACIGGTSQLWAQGDGTGSSNEHVELAEISVVGRQLEEKLSTELAEYGHKVQVINSEALTKSGYVTVSQALTNMVPGFYMRSAGRSSRTMRMNGSSNFLMLLDGVRLNNRMFGSTASPDSIGIHMVDHIEVLFGGEGLFYGTDATAGVINIVTKKPTEETSGLLNLSYGSYGSTDASAYVSGSLGKNRILVHGHKEKYDGYQLIETDVFRNNGVGDMPGGLKSNMERDNFGIKFSREFELDGTNLLEASVIKNTNKYRTPSPSYLFQDYDGDETISYLKWAHDINDNYSYFIKIYHHDWWAEWTGQEPSGAYESYKEKYGFQDWGVHLMNSYRFDQGSELLFGMEYQNYWGKDEVMDQPATKHEEVTAGYISFRPHFSFWPEWKTSFGVRYNYMVEESSTIWNVSSKMPFFDNTVYLAANAGTTFRLPTGLQLYQNPDGAHGGYVGGNPDLKPQESLYATVGLGGNWQYGGLDLTGFYEKVTDRIQVINGSGPGGIDMYQNIDGDTLIRGFTLSGYLKPIQEVTLSGSYTRQSEKRDGIKQERQTWPEDYGNISLAWDGEISGWKAGAGVSNNYTGKQYYRQTEQHQYGEYWTTDLNLYVKPTESTTIALQFSNLFDEDTAYSMGRTRPTPGSPLDGKQESDGYYYYDSRVTPFSATLSVTYQF